MVKSKFVTHGNNSHFSRLMKLDDYFESHRTTSEVSVIFRGSWNRIIVSKMFSSLKPIHQYQVYAR